MARQPFPHQAERRTTRPLQLVHTDSCGPMQNVTPGGNKYFMAIIDDFSRYIVLYLLKDKSEATACVKNYVRFTENQFGRKPAIIRSDRGGEFVNKELEQFYRSEGIQSQLTAGYSPQQNGVAQSIFERHVGLHATRRWIEEVLLGRGNSNGSLHSKSPPVAIRK